MAGDLKLKYGTPGTFTTTALNSLANSTTAGVTTESVDNTSTLAVDYLISGSFTMGTPSSPVAMKVYAYAAFNTTPTWPDLFSSGTEGTAGAATVHDTEQLDAGFRLLWAAVPDTTTNDILVMPPTSIAAAFGAVPPYFAIFALNNTGAAIHSSGHAMYYVPILYQYT